MSFPKRLNSTTEDLSQCLSLSRRAYRQAHGKAMKQCFSELSAIPVGIWCSSFTKSLPPAEIKCLKNGPGLRGGKVCLIKPHFHRHKTESYQEKKPSQHLPCSRRRSRKLWGKGKNTLNLLMSNISESASGDKKACRNIEEHVGIYQHPSQRSV